MRCSERLRLLQAVCFLPGFARAQALLHLLRSVPPLSSYLTVHKLFHSRNAIEPWDKLWSMAVIVHTSVPSTLLKNIKKAIDEDHIETWAYDENGDFTHTAQQWENRAWLRPTVASGALLLGLLGQQNEDVTTVIYGVYHGRFIEMLL